MLWTMLNAMCLLVSIMASVVAARDAKTGFVGYTLAVVFGVALGGCATWAMWTAGERVV